jgi:hypothetical protein
LAWPAPISEHEREFVDLHGGSLCPPVSPKAFEFPLSPIPFDQSQQKKPQPIFLIFFYFKPF